MRTILYNPVFLNPQAYYVFPQLYDIEPKTDDFVEPAVYAGRLVVNSTDSDLYGVYNGEKEIDFSKYAGENIRISQYTDEGSTVLGEWRLPATDIEVDFSVLNYDIQMQRQAIDCINKIVEQNAKLVADWNPSITSLNNKFRNKKDLLFCPYFDTSNVTNWSSCFHNSGVVYIPSLDTSKATNMEAMCWDAKNLNYIPDLDYSNVLNMKNAFRGMNLRSGEYNITIKDGAEINGILRSTTDIDGNGIKVVINGSPSKVDESFGYSYIIDLYIDLKNVISNGNLMWNNAALRIFRSPQFGRSPLTSWDFSAPNLGIDNDKTNGEAEAALMKTFITDSWNRLANDMEPATLKFHDNTKALFTQEHIEIMKNKGYNLA